jgi:hypothetical protein
LAGANPFRAPVDIKAYSPTGIACLQYATTSSQMAVNLAFRNSSAPTGGVNSSGSINFYSPVKTSYMMVLSRLFQKAAEPIFYAWVGAAGPTSDSIYNSSRIQS